MSTPSASRRSRAEIAGDVRRGIQSSLCLAAFFLLIALVNAVRSKGQAAAQLGLTHWEVQLPLLYIGGAVVAGAVIGLAKPLTRTLAGAMVLGVLVAFPLLLVVSPIAVPKRSLLDRLVDSTLLAVLLGPIYAWAVWSKPQGTDKGAEANDP